MSDGNGRSDSLGMVWLAHTRSAVWNVLMGIGLAIAVSGWLLAQRPVGVRPFSAAAIWKWSHLTLLAIISLSTTARLLSITRWASQSPRRFLWTHVASALFAGLAIPLGFAFAWLVRPELDAVGPFWVVALILALLALPRRDEAELLDTEISSRHASSIADADWARFDEPRKDRAR